MSTSETQSEPLPGDVGKTPAPASPSLPLVRALVAALLVAAAAAAVGWIVGNGLRLQEVVNTNRYWGGSRLDIPRATRNGAMAYGAVGALLAAGLAVSGAFAARRLSPVGLFVGVATGLVLGASLPAASCYPLFPWYFAQMEKTDFQVALLTHLGTWTTVGAAAGAAFGLGVGRRDVFVRSVVGGITGAALGAVLYEIGGLFAPFAHTERPLAEMSETRLVANLVLALCVAIGTVVVAAQQPRDPLKKPNDPTA